MSIPEDATANRLDEIVTSEDYIGLEDEKRKVLKLLERQTKYNKTVFVAYVGSLGCGKSTTLEGVRKRVEGKYKWIRFEPWRYSDRSEIWDGFVIELSAYIKGKSKDSIARKIDGGKMSILAKCVVGLVLLFITVCIFASHNIWVSAGSSRFHTAWLKYALPPLVAGLGFVGLSSILGSINITPKNGSISRVFQLEQLLKKSIRKMLKQPLVIVIEDIDRTGEEGLVFLETAKSFFKNNQFGVGIIVIAPQAPESFAPHSATELDAAFDQNLKIYDYPIYFTSDKSNYDYKKYYDNLGLDKSEKTQVVRVMQVLTTDLNQQVSLRLFKYALREAYEFTRSYTDASLSVAFILIMSRYIKVDLNDGRVYSAARIIKAGWLQDKLHELLPHFLVLLADPDHKWDPGVSRIRIRFNSLSDEQRRINGDIDRRSAIVDVTLDSKYEALL